MTINPPEYRDATKDETCAVVWMHRKEMRWSLKWPIHKIMALKVNGRIVEEHVLERSVVWFWQHTPPDILVHDEFPNRFVALDWFVGAMRVHRVGCWQPPIPAFEKPINPEMDHRRERSKKLRITMGEPRDF